MTLGTLTLPLAAEQGGGGGITPLLLLLGLGIFTYFILVRPQRSRMKQLQRTQASLTTGVEVMTTAGLYATVVDFDDDSVTLETAPGVHNRYVRAAVAKIVTPVEDGVDEDVDDDDADVVDADADVVDDGDDGADEVDDEVTDGDDDEVTDGDDGAPEDASRSQR